MIDTEAPTVARSATENELRRPLLEHLDELLVRARRSVMWIALGAAIGYLASQHLVEFMVHPIRALGKAGPELITTQPFEKFWIYLRVAFVAGVFFVIPLVAREIAAFVAPGLKPTEKKRVAWLTGSVYVAFLLGVLMGYTYVLPVILKAIMRFGEHGAGETARWTISSYINTAMGILLLSAVFMEIPVVMVHLTSWGWVDVKTWTKGRRIAFVVNAVVSGLLSPPDPMSMIMMMVPVQILYECGILIARMAKWMQNEKP